MIAHIAHRDEAIRMLRMLISASPHDSTNRIRLLKLLFNNRRRSEFVEEAVLYRENCDLSYDTNWIEICRMGREIDPGNGQFEKVPPENNRVSRSGRTRPKITKAKAKSRQLPEPISVGAKPKPEQVVEAEVVEHDGSNRRVIADRRQEDRRKMYSGWLGGERRQQPRRRQRRRASDKVA